MNQKTIQRMLDQIAELSCKLDDAVKATWGDEAFIFAEADGSLYVMDGDSDGRFAFASDRQEHIVMTAKSAHRLGVGAW